jgi:glutamate synthase (NADPH/NADH) small chain
VKSHFNVSRFLIKLRPRLPATHCFIPEFTGRICPAPCESACVLGINQPAITIEEIEKHIIEIAFEKGFVQPKNPNLRTGKKIAVIGSGPAGLATAAQLNYAGHHVTVFERDDAPGGLLRYGIPDFKLEKWVIDRRIKLLEQEGVTFKCNSNVGVNVNIADIINEHNAVVIAAGSTIPRDLDIPGRDLEGVYFAMDFLKQQNKRVSNKEVAGKDIITTGQDVIVIGGGDTGSDCVGTSNRQGASSVTQLELMPKPPVSRTEVMPWPTYPMTLKTSSSHEEGANREWAVLTKRFIGEGGKLTGIELVDIVWKASTPDKPARFEEVPETTRLIPCQKAFLAMGFLHPQHKGFIQDLGLELDARGNVLANESDYNTSVHKVFAAGDTRRGQSLVVWAISEGRECARKVDEYLMGTSSLESKDKSYLINI